MRRTPTVAAPISGSDFAKKGFCGKRPSATGAITTPSPWRFSVTTGWRHGPQRRRRELAGLVRAQPLGMTHTMRWQAKEPFNSYSHLFGVLLSIAGLVGLVVQ